MPDASPLAPPGWPIAARGLFMAYVGPLCFVHLREGIDEAGERLHAEELARAIDTRPPDARVGVLYEVPHSLGITALARSSIARLLNERREILRHTTVAYALATPSAFVRGMLQAVFWIAPPPYPHDMFSARREGLTYLARHLPGLDVARVDSACERLLEQHRAVVIGAGARA